jgi:hypothetical protein
VEELEGFEARHHVLVRTAESATQSTLECFDGCGRLMVIDHRTGARTILHVGDPMALHQWSDLDVSMSVAV